MGPLKVVEVLPGLEPAVKLIEAGDDHSLELAMELFTVDSVRAFRLPVQVGASRPDVAVLDAFVEHVPVELGTELAGVVGLDALHLKRQPRQDLVHKGDGGLLGVPVVDLEDPDPGAVVDRRVLVVALPMARQRIEEFDVHLELVPWQRLFVAPVALRPPAVAHVRGQAVHPRFA